MKMIKIFLAVTAGLLLIAIGFGVYVWYQLFSLSQTGKEIQNSTAPAEQPARTSDTETGSAQEPDTPIITKPVTVNEDAISEEQQERLEAFGIDTTSITITPEMVSCAEDAIGRDRVEAIIEGAAPSAAEVIKLIPCL